jgi:hypothetical protein
MAQEALIGSCLRGNFEMKKRYFLKGLLFAYLILGWIHPLWASDSNLKTFTFPDVVGWRQSGEIQTFNPETLFEYINGGADLYLTYDFQELKVGEYSNEKKASVIIEVYRHKTPILAFGIYSQERLPDADFLEIGSQGYIETNVLNFLAGSTYVKINSFKTGADDREILMTFAKRISEALGPGGVLPSILSSFPEEGKKKNSEKFISKNFLGYSFLHSAFAADYSLSGTTFKLFVIELTDKTECKNMIQKYLEQTGKKEENVTEGRYLIRDPHHGEIELDWQGAYVWGILSLNNPDLRSKYLKLFEQATQKRK